MRGTVDPTRDPIPDLGILIPAAGRGERMGLGPKALLEMAGRPLVSWLAAKALGVGSEVLVAVPPGEEERFRPLCPGCRVLSGGPRRQDTIALLLRASTRPWVLVQDLARPFVSAALMKAVAAAARETGAAGAFLAPEVPVARIEGGLVVGHFRSGEVGVFQAPQAFERALLMRVLEEAEARGWTEQSTLQLVLRAGAAVRAVPGEKTNLKLTTPEDWKLAGPLKELLP
jgi:2-C-methyl-D-erythritol 4-phosphate cytidylyltransferase